MSERCLLCLGQQAIFDDDPLYASATPCWRCDGTGVEPLPAPTTPDHPVSPAHGDLGRHSEEQER